MARYTHLLFEVLILLGGASATLLLGDLARRRPEWLLGAFGLVIVLTPKSGQLSLGSVAGVNVLGTDPVLMLAVGATLFGLPQLIKRIEGLEVLLGALILMILVQAGIGFITFGTAAALQVRGMLVLVGLAAFVLSLEDQRNPQELVRRWLYWTAGGVCAFALMRAMTSGIGSASLTMLTPQGEAVNSRVASAAQILVVAAAAVQSLYENTVKYRNMQLLRTGLFLVVVLIGQHRSVWAAISVAIGIATYRSMMVRRIVPLLAGGILVCCLASPLLYFSGTGGQVRQAVGDSLATVSSTTGTGGARVDSNAQLISRARAKGGLIELLGSPYGTPVERIENGRIVTFDPHNAYVQVFLNLGLAGLALVLGILGSLMVRCWRRRASELGLALLFVVFGLAYSFPPELAPVLATFFMVPAAGPVRNGGRPHPHVQMTPTKPVGGSREVLVKRAT